MKKKFEFVSPAVVFCRENRAYKARQIGGSSQQARWSKELLLLVTWSPMPITPSRDMMPHLLFACCAHGSNQKRTRRKRTERPPSTDWTFPHRSLSNRQEGKDGLLRPAHSHSGTDGFTRRRIVCAWARVSCGASCLLVLYMCRFIILLLELC